MVKPEKVFKAGAVRAAVFRNPVRRAGGEVYALPKVILEVRYRDEAGQWKGTSSLSVNDLPKATLVLQQAFAYLLEHKDAREPAASGRPDNAQM